MNNLDNSFDALLDRLRWLQARWETAYEKRNGKEPGMPLRWSVDTAGILRLNQIWVCPAKYVDQAALKNAYVDDVTVSLPLVDGLCNIIIKDGGELGICAIERRPAP